MCASDSEDLAVVDADALEDAVAVEQAVVVDADLGVGFVEELAVDPDLKFHGDFQEIRSLAADKAPVDVFARKVMVACPPVQGLGSTSRV